MYIFHCRIIMAQMQTQSQRTGPKLFRPPPVSSSFGAVPPLQPAQSDPSTSLSTGHNPLSTFCTLPAYNGAQNQLVPQSQTQPQSSFQPFQQYSYPNSIPCPPRPPSRHRDRDRASTRPEGKRPRSREHGVGSGPGGFREVDLDSLTLNSSQFFNPLAPPPSQQSYSAQVHARLNQANFNPLNASRTIPLLPPTAASSDFASASIGGAGIDSYSPLTYTYPGLGIGMDLSTGAPASLRTQSQAIGASTAVSGVVDPSSGLSAPSNEHMAALLQRAAADAPSALLEPVARQPHATASSHTPRLAALCSHDRVRCSAEPLSSLMTVLYCCV